jgi:hypothetical protein
VKFNDSINDFFENNVIPLAVTAVVVCVCTVIIAATGRFVAWMFDWM